MDIVTVKDLSFTHAGKSSQALRNVSFSLKKGSINLLCGPTGCGKTTLLRLLKKEISPAGTVSGEIAVNSGSVGYIFQRPEEQIVTDKVWHELAFGLENMGVKPEEIRRRTAETAEYFGISEWFFKDTASLSGGQKQLLNLASVTVMQPELIILDEPTAQLDPVFAAEFMDMVERINRELSVTFLLCEHRLTECMGRCDNFMIMDKGELIFSGAPENCSSLIAERPAVKSTLPGIISLFSELLPESPLPLGIQEARELLIRNFKNGVSLPRKAASETVKKSALRFSEVWFSYEKNGRPAVKNLSADIKEGEIFCIFGGNGSGKSTFLSLAAGLYKPQSGKISLFGRDIKKYSALELCETAAYLHQDPETLFLKDSVREELPASGAYDGLFDFKEYLDTHPYDLSGGEKQLLALRKVLARSPKLLMLDEPTKGLDGAFREKLTGIINELKKNGVTVVVVTHDTEFAAGIADSCAMFFGGECISVSPKDDFFSENYFYTTSAARVSRGYYEKTVTCGALKEACLLNGKKDVHKE